MSENKYHIKIARDETRSMGRAQRLWYRGTAKWFLVLGLVILAGVGATLAYVSVHSNPVPKVSGARIVNPVIQDTSPHYYLKINKGTAKTSQNGTAWQAAKNGTILQSGDQVQTGDDSYLTLISNQNTVVRLAPDSQLTVNDVSAPSAKIFQTNLKLTKGQAWTHIVTNQDEKVIFSLSTDNFLVNTDVGTFAAENTPDQRIASAAGKISVKEISLASSSDSILKDSITHEYSLEAGKTLLYKGSGKDVLDVTSVSAALSASYWFTWNKEQDADYERSLRNSVSQNGPPLTLDNQTAVITVTDPFYTVTGRTSLDARIFVNNFEAANQAGTFSHKIAVPNGLKTPFPVNVVSVDHLGNRSVKTFSLSYSTSDVAEIPIVTGSGVALNLSAESTEGGVELVWNSVPASAYFDGYHLVRSETDGSLSYPKNSEYTKVADAKSALFLDSQVTDGAKYFYRVCVKSSDTRYDCSNVFEIMFVKPVTEPGSLHVQGKA